MSNNTCIWFEIPISDLEKGRPFYSAVIGRALGIIEHHINPILLI